MRSQTEMPWIGRALVSISAIVAITVLTIAMLNFFDSAKGFKGPIERHCDISAASDYPGSSSGKITLYCDK